MKQKMFIICLSMALFCGTSQARNWNKLIKAIIQIETKGDEKATNGRCAGIIQITPIMVHECNLYQNKIHFSLKDRFNREASIKMFKIFQDKYNPEGNIEKAVRLWNGGPKYTLRATNNYTRKVLNIYYK